MAKNDEQNELLFLEKTRIERFLDEIKNENAEFTDTIQVQVNLKGLDPRRDNKITKDISMPHKARNLAKTIVLADKDTAKVSGKIPYVLKDDDKVENIFQNALKTYRLRVKDMSVTSFPIGDTKMNNEELYENLKHGMSVVTAALKKGEENIKNVFLKGAQKAPKQVY
ncbi:60s ribosomal protein l10a [Vairimorpha apis BRL 01]|uniref:60s ribosomal protein l10a n=1 Tax=Vairimorpha apis BRL 01 TaxID=1037528 RepID=T0MGF8_9MICR|nr:60s ribosomal protein l10a [Vairimorpha apis BRL 01]